MINTKIFKFIVILFFAITLSGCANGQQDLNTNKPIIVDEDICSSGSDIASLISAESDKECLQPGALKGSCNCDQERETCRLEMEGEGDCSRNCVISLETRKATIDSDCSSVSN